MAKAAGHVTTPKHELLQFLQESCSRLCAPTSKTSFLRLYRNLSKTFKFLKEMEMLVEYYEKNYNILGARLVHRSQGSHFKYMKHRIDSLDENNYEIKYTVFEGDMMGNNLTSISCEIKFKPSGSGCVCKTTTHYKTQKEGNELKEEEIKAGKDKAIEMYKNVENHLVANPTLYA